jgi:hypothetical protein
MNLKKKIVSLLPDSAKKPPSECPIAQGGTKENNFPLQAQIFTAKPELTILTFFISNHIS